MLTVEGCIQNTRKVLLSTTSCLWRDGEWRPELNSGLSATPGGNHGWVFGENTKCIICLFLLLKNETVKLCAGGEGLAQNRDQRLQGWKRQLLQPGGGRGLHVRRPHSPQKLPVGHACAPSQGEGRSSSAMLKREHAFIFWVLEITLSASTRWQRRGSRWRVLGLLKFYADCCTVWKQNHISTFNTVCKMQLSMLFFGGFCNAFKRHLVNLTSVLLMETISNKCGVCADKRTPLNVPYMILAIFLFSNKKLVLIFLVLTLCWTIHFSSCCSARCFSLFNAHRIYPDHQSKWTYVFSELARASLCGVVDQ